MVVFQDALYMLDYIGITDVFLPFILIFTIVFAVLQKINLFAKEGAADGSRKFNAVIALALAIGVIIPHSLGKYPPGTDIVEILNNALPGVSLLIVALVFFLILIGMFGGQPKWADASKGGIVTFIALAIIIFIFGNAAGWWEATGVLYWLSDPYVQWTLLIILGFWLVFSFIIKGPDNGGSWGRFFGAPGSPPATPPQTPPTGPPPGGQG